MVNKVIVTTTINSPTEALLKFASFKDWDLVIVGDLKTPHNLYEELEKNDDNVKYLSPKFQEDNYKELSDAISFSPSNDLFNRSPFSFGKRLIQ